MLLHPNAICASAMLLIFLFGCSAPRTPIHVSTSNPPSSSDGSSMAIRQQIRLRTCETCAVLGEVRSAEGFYGVATSLPEVQKNKMKVNKSWHQGCPVALSELSYLVLTHWGFDGEVKVGELVVHRRLALTVLNACADLFAAHYPIEKMVLIENYSGSDDLSMADNNSSAFNCRAITGKPGVFSKHSYGGALDINPLQNPYVAPKSAALVAMGWDAVENKGEFLRRKGYAAPSPAWQFCTERPADCLVLPPAAAVNVDRRQKMPGYLDADGAAVKAFTHRGFEWGGNWSSLLDYQHFEYDTTLLLKQ